MPPVRVFLTVDTEFWPAGWDLSPDSVAKAVEADVYGLTPEGEYGIRYQMDELDRHGLKAVFLIESLSAHCCDPAHLARIVGDVQGRGHDAQLHLHTEWAHRSDPPLIAGALRMNLRDFSLDEQTLLLDRALALLREAGAESVRAFRAGNYGANLDTLRALARLGIPFDTSHNTAFMGRTCDMPTEAPLLQPTELHGVLEFPIGFFRDWPGHVRHVQLAACSESELRMVMEAAWREGWYSLVIVSHSFELVDAERRKGDATMLRRHRWLCRYLAENRDRFVTSTFADLERAAVPQPAPASVPRSHPGRTALRILGQACRRILP